MKIHIAVGGAYIISVPIDLVHTVLVKSYY